MYRSDLYNATLFGTDTVSCCEDTRALEIGPGDDGVETRTLTGFCGLFFVFCLFVCLSGCLAGLSEVYLHRGGVHA